MGGLRKIVRVVILGMIGLGSVAIDGRSLAKDRIDEFSGLIDWNSASCLDQRVVGNLEAELRRLGATAAVCDATALDRLLSIDLAALDRGCKAVNEAAVSEVVALLADPKKSEFTCDDGLAMTEKVNKAFRDGVAQHEASESRPPAATRDERSLDELLGEVEARGRITGPLRRTITDAIRQKVERNWSVPKGILDVGEMVVTLRIQLGPDGSVRRVEIVDADGAGMYRTMAESARRAVLKASPFESLARYVDKYEGWREVTMTFSPPV